MTLGWCRTCRRFKVVVPPHGRLRTHSAERDLSRFSEQRYRRTSPVVTELCPGSGADPGELKGLSPA